jgi:hypothetical protein
MLHATLLRGKAAAVPALQTALGEVATRLGGTRERRQRLGRRLEGGCGTTERRNGLRSRGEQGVPKSSHRGRGGTWRQRIGPWQPTARPGRERAPVLHPHRFCRATRPGVRRTPQEKGGSQDAVGVTTWPDLEPVALAEAYDGRAMSDATFCQAKQAWGLVPRRQRRWEAQPRVLLVARLAHHRLLWGKQWRRRGPTTRGRWRGDGLGRWRRDVWAVPGGIRWRRGWMVRVRFSPLHPRATPLQESFAALFHGRVRVGILREKLAAAVRAGVYRQARRQRCERWAAMTGTERAASRAGRTGERHLLA